MIISVIIPVLNEEKIIQRTISQVVKSLEKTSLEFEIILVDDGSTDNTWELISNTIKTDQRIKGIKLSRNFGHDAAVFAGLKLTQADATITMDSDGQHPFEILPKLINTWRETSCDVVNAVKFSRGKQKLLHSWGAQIFGKILSRTMKINLNSSTEFKLINRKARESLLECGDHHYFYRALVPWVGFHQQTVTFDVGKAMRSESHWNFFSLFEFALSGFVMFSDAPIKFILLIGVLSLIACFFLMIKLIVVFFSIGVADGYSTILAMVLLNTGLLMTGLGILGIYVRTILNQTKNRPRAIIDLCIPSKMLEESKNRYL